MRIRSAKTAGIALLAFTFGALGALALREALWSAAFAQGEVSSDLSLELVDPKVLRVCADPRNMPFSNEAGEGFENKLGELFAQKLGKSLAYAFYPGATGFVRNTLNAHRCDVIIGIPQGDDIVQPTNPYYRTSYTIVVKTDSDLAQVDSLADLRLKDKRIGIVAGTPPATFLAVNGLLAKAKSYPLVVDTRYDAPSVEMIEDLVKGNIDAAILWGPIAGYYSKKHGQSLHLMPLLKETGGPRMVYRIGMGVRHTDQEWKRLLNKLIAENRGAITKILLDYGVPLLDENNQPIGQ
jgi:quinoprotein dehydrogenase-associated probable ABC transporter substrate-binding protein